jgi:flavorubredoxin
MTEVLDARAVIVGSPTLNNNLFPTVSDFLTYMKGLKPHNKIGAAFGSYGWSGEAVKQIAGGASGDEVRDGRAGVAGPVCAGQGCISACEDFGRKIAEAMQA